MQPRSRQWHLLDYVLVRERDQRDVLVTKAILGVKGWTVHHLAISQMRIRLQPHRIPQDKRPLSKLNIAVMSLPAHNLHFSNELTQRLANLPVAAAAALDVTAVVSTAGHSPCDGAGCTRTSIVTHRYRTDGQLLNHRRMHFQSRVSTTTVHELLFADDCALNATSEKDMQRSMDLFAAAFENFGLVINTEKTVVMHQPPPNTATPPNAPPPPQISVNGTQLQVGENFTYLGSILSRSTKIDDEVARWISKASKAFGRLQSTVWNRHGLYLNTTPKMYKSVILPTQL
ncbi:hypothetical protein SprV_0702411900 [Sparganum proliferum]